MQRLGDDEGRILDNERQLSAAQASLGTLRSAVDPLPARISSFEGAHAELAAAAARADAALQKALTETNVRIDRTDTRVMEHESSVGVKLKAQENVIAVVDSRTQDVARQVGAHWHTTLLYPVVWS